MSSEPGSSAIGLLGHGTVGCGVRRAARASARDAVEATVGLRPQISGVLTRSRGDFDEILADSRPDRRADGRDRARARVRAARRCAAGKHVVTANKQLLSQHGEELWAAARDDGVQLRFEAAVAGVVPVIRVLEEIARRRARRAHARHRQRHDELHPLRDGRDRRHLRGGAGRGAASSATRRPTRPRTSTAATRRRRWRSSPGWRSARRCASDEVRYEGIEHITADDLEYARELGLRAEADRHRRARRRRAVGPRAPGVPLRRPPAGQRRRPVQRGHRRVRGDHRDHDVGPGRGRAADGQRRARRRRLGDDPAGLAAAGDASRPDRRGRRVGLLPAPRGRRPAGRARPGRADPRHAGGVGEVGRPEGPGRRRAAGDGRSTRCSSRASSARCELIGAARLRCAPRRGRSGSSRRSSSEPAA